MADPWTNPRLYDRITLDGEEVECLAVIDGGDRTSPIEQQVSPGYAGAYTVAKLEKLSEVSYEFRMWEPAHLKTMRAWIARLHAGRKKRPNPKVWRLGDPRLEHNSITQVVTETISRLIQPEPGVGLYVFRVVFKEYGKRRQIGGVALPAKTETDKQIELVAAQNAALEKQLAALAKQQGAGAP